MDVKTTFLNGYLEEDIYMEQSLGFTSSDDDHRICKEPRRVKTSDRTRIGPALLAPGYAASAGGRSDR